MSKRGDKNILIRIMHATSKQHAALISPN